MTNLNVLENKISSVKKYLNILEDFKKYSKEDIKNNIQIRGSLERFLYLAVQSCIDLASALVSFKKLRKPTSQRESFEILEENKVLPNSLTKELVKMVGFRNVIAHDYEDVDYEIVYDVLNNKLPDIEDFLNIVEKQK